jgi:hypothetical protein
MTPSTTSCRTTLLNLAMSLPTPVAAQTSGGTAYRVVLSGRKAWAATIAAQVRRGG